MTARELRQKYLEFFQSKGHLLHPSGSLVPYDVTGRLDESLLFNGAGMVQFKPYFRGIAEPPSKRLTNCQKCVRTGDIEEIGDLTHLSFFEMLGNFSFGDYFKNEAIAFSWEFLTSSEWLGLDPKRLSFTVFEEDDESLGHWATHLQAAGIDPAARVFRLGEDTNYWPAGAFSSGPPGPCGPNTEMFYWVLDSEPPPSGPYLREDWSRDEAAGKWLEVWNDVFIQYEWKGALRDPSRPDKGYEKQGMDDLPFQSVDTGMGLERTITVLNGKRSVYDNDLFEPLFRVLSSVVSPDVRERAGDWATGHSEEAKAGRVIADHIRSACLCIGDGILPSNTGRGYVLRRLIRRAVLKGDRALGIGEVFLWKLYEGVAEALGGVYDELVSRREVIVETLKNEEELFRGTLERGLLHWGAIAQLISESVAELARAMQLVRSFRPDPEGLSDFLSRYGVESGLETIYPSEASQGLQPTSRTITFVEWCKPIAQAIRNGASIADVDHLEAETKSRVAVFPGTAAFQLYDTYGFPLEVTQELCAEAGIEVDIDGFYEALKEAQERSRAARGNATVYGGVVVRFDLSVLSGQQDDAKPTPTRFVGYDATETQATIVGTCQVEGGQLAVALDQTPFYAESGGEVSDTGVIEGEGFRLEVLDLIKQDGVYVHLAEPDFDATGLTQEALNQKLFRQAVTARVDAPRRRKITRNHTATHLLHAALRQVLGKHVTQAGSLVAPDHLRFDFTHSKGMTPVELAEVERLVNERVLEARPVQVHSEVPIAEAKKRGAMALFGEKYGDTVRMIEVPGFSLELCGGCHVRNTAEIGLFKVLHESSAASGVRRIEAVTGEGAYEWVRQMESTLYEASSKLKAQAAELPSAIERLQEQLRDERKRLERLRSQAPSASPENVVDVEGIELAVESLTNADMQETTLVADRLAEGNPRRVAVVAGTSNGKVMLVAKVGEEAMGRGAHAGNLVRDLAKIVGGGGGGRPDFATAGGKDPSRVNEALSIAEAVLRKQVQ